MRRLPSALLLAAPAVAATVFAPARQTAAPQRLCVEAPDIDPDLLPVPGGRL